MTYELQGEVKDIKLGGEAARLVVLMDLGVASLLHTLHGFFVSGLITASTYVNDMYVLFHGKHPLFSQDLHLYYSSCSCWRQLCIMRSGSELFVSQALSCSLSVTSALRCW